MRRYRSVVPEFCLLLAICLSPISAAWHPHPEVGTPFTRYHAPSDYGGGPLNFQMADDSRGNLFVANENGLLKYDGARWSFMPQTGNSTFINCVTVDHRDRIWVAGLEAVGYFEVSNREYVYRDMTQSIGDLSGRDRVGQFYSLHAADGFVYLTADYSLLRWDGSSWTVWEFPQDMRILPHWVNGEIYVHVRGHGLYRLEDGEFELYAPSDHAYSSGIIKMLPNGRGKILCVTVKDGILSLKDGEFRPLATEIDESLGGAVIYDALQIDEQVYALSIDPLGLVILDSEGRLLSLLELGPSRAFSLWYDSSNGLWGSTGQGMVHLPYLSLSTFPLDSAVDDLVRHQGTLFLCFHNSLKALKTAAWPGATTASFETVSEDPSPYRLLSTDHGLLFGGQKGFGFLDDAERPETVHLGRQVVAFTASKQNPLLAYAVDVPKVSRLRFSERKWKYFDSIENPMGLRLSIAELPDGSLLAGTESGPLERIIWPGDSEAAAEVRALGREHGLPEQFKWAYCLNVQDNYVVISDRGLYRYDLATGRFQFDPALGYRLGNDPFALRHCPLADAEGWALWLPHPGAPNGGEVGKLLVDGERLVWRPLELPGLNELGRIKSIYHESIGETAFLWLAGPEQLHRYDLNARPHAPKRSTRITGIEETQTNRVFYSGAGELPENMRVDFPQKNMMLTFAGEPHSLSIRYYESRLLGFEDEWYADKDRAFREYSNLREGDYTFEVRVIDEYGRPGPVTEFGFTIDPPWYRTSIAYSAYSLLALGFVVLLVRSRTLVLRRRNEELESTVQQRTAELKERNLQLIRANSVKQNFLASMSHEIRNPLNGILGIAQLLRKDAGNNRISQDSVRHLNACATHLHQLLGQVLDYSSLEAGKLTLRNETFDPNELIDDVVSMHRELADSKSLSLKAEMPRQECQWIGDPVMIRQILINLISNAIKYTKCGGVRVAVESQVRQSEIQARFIVEDTGPGIPEDKREYIFEDFTRLSKAGESEVPGTGLGLAIASGLSNLLGGTLRLDPAYDEGARFVLELELEKGSPIASHFQSTGLLGGTPLKNKRVLIADDMSFNRYICRELLEQVGAQVDEAVDGEEALEKLLNAHFDLAILDINMPKRSGNSVVETFLRQSEAQRKPIFVALSAHVSVEMEVSCREAGFVRFTQKPLETTDLEMIIDMMRGESPRHEQHGPPVALFDYLAHSDDAAKESLNQRYRQSFLRELGLIRKQLTDGQLSGIRETIHKLKGLAALRQDSEVLALLDEMSERINSAPAEPSAPLMEELSQLCDSLENRIGD